MLTYLERQHSGTLYYIALMCLFSFRTHTQTIIQIYYAEKYIQELFDYHKEHKLESKQYNQYKMSLLSHAAVEYVYVHSSKAIDDYVPSDQCSYSKRTA